MIIDFRNRSMKSEPPGSGRQQSGSVPGACDTSKGLRNGDRSDAMLRQVSLVAAFHDHISCAKSAELLDPMPCETDHLYAHCGDDAPEAPDDTELERLRTLVLMHTDLLQHQHEVIAERERQIDELRSQRDELQEQLRRLQACVVHVGCQTDDMFVDVEAPAPLLAELLRPIPDELQSEVPSEPVVEVAPCESEEAPAVREEEPVVQEHRGVTPVPKVPVEPSGTPSPTARKATEPTRGEEVQKQQAEPPPPPPRGPPPAAEDEERAQEAPAEVPAAPVQSSSQEAAAPPESSARKGGRKRSAAARDDAGRVLLADHPYPAGAPRPEPSQEPVEAIEVPTWRINPVTSLYSMEGTENIDDEVFLKRHAKLEANEKRRKRWDLQLLREQQHTERLRRRMERTVEKPPSCPPTFSGELKHIHFVEVVEDLPVLAFGQPIPDTQPAEFVVPWVKKPLRHHESSGERTPKKQRKNIQKGPCR